MRTAVLSLLGLMLCACPAEDDDEGSGNGGDVAADTGSSDSSDSAVVDEVVGFWNVVSITLGGSTLTTQNQDLGDGVQRRVVGTLDIAIGGTYSRQFQFFEDDVLGETENASGTWSLESDDVVVITEDSEEPSRVQFSIDGNTLTLTRLEGSASFAVDAMVLQRQPR